MKIFRSFAQFFVHNFNINGLLVGRFDESFFFTFSSFLPLHIYPVVFLASFYFHSLLFFLHSSLCPFLIARTHLHLYSSCSCFSASMPSTNSFRSTFVFDMYFFQGYVFKTILLWHVFPAKQLLQTFYENNLGWK